MYFFHKSSKLYITLVTRPKYIWYSLSVSIYLLFFSVWFVILNKPLNKILKSQKVIINNLKNIVDKSPDNPEINKIWAKKNFEKQNLTERFSRLKSEFQSNNQDQISLIIEEACKSGLKVNLYDYKPEQNKTWYSKYIFELDLLGEFEKITNFLDKLNNNNFKIKFFDFIAKKSANNLINLKITVQMLDIKNEK